MYNSLLYTIGLIAGWIALICVLGIILAIPTMLLWNACLVPAAAGISKIGLLQAWGLNVLCALLFKDINSSN